MIKVKRVIKLANAEDLCFIAVQSPMGKVKRHTSRLETSEVVCVAAYWPFFRIGHVTEVSIL